MSPTSVHTKIGLVNRTHVADRVQVTREHVSQILSGRKVPSLSVAAKVAKEVGVTLDDFYEYWRSLRAS